MSRMKFVKNRQFMHFHMKLRITQRVENDSQQTTINAKEAILISNKHQWQH